MIYGIGTDLCDVGRIEKSIARPAFLQHVYTPAEQELIVAHTGKKGTGVLLVPGMIFTIEPMLNEGRKGVFIDSANDWTVYTEDGSLSAQWEHTILITETGAEILTY